MADAVINLKLVDAELPFQVWLVVGWVLVLERQGVQAVWTVQVQDNYSGLIFAQNNPKNQGAPAHIL